MDLNAKIPWSTDSYVELQKGDLAQSKHAILHLIKATGRLAELIEPLDHKDGEKSPHAPFEKYLADIVICAARIANLVPIDLEAAVLTRLARNVKVHDE